MCASWAAYRFQSPSSWTEDRGGRAMAIRSAKPQVGEAVGVWPAAAQCKEVPHLVERQSAGQAGVGAALVYVGQRWSLAAEPAKDADGRGDVAVGMTLLAA